MASNINQDDILSQFCSMTGITPAEARPFLDANHWDVDAAVTEYFADQEEELLRDMEASGGRRLGSDDPTEQPSRSRSLGQTPPATSQRSQGRSGAGKKIATLRDLSSGDGGRESGNGDDENQDFFAGGEKSGLAVQNPDDIKQKIIEKAKAAQPLPSDDPKPKKTYFTGAARTLGGDDTPSQVVHDPNGNRPQRPPRVQRTLHFWADGFSVEDGELYRSDDPRNAKILEGIRRGRAPLSIMDVLPGQDVDVNIQQHEEKYTRPKPKYKPFSGVGQRLGSPTPAIRSSQPEPAAAAAAASPSEAARPEIDESQPTVTLQIRLGDGTRLTSRFNTTHTIGDVYSFVSAASPASQSRPWVLMTTFPSKELTDKSALLGDLPDFRRGGVVVQKWQ